MEGVPAGRVYDYARFVGALFFLYWITGEKHLEDRFQVGVITTTHGVREK